ncbi:MAG: PQQ-binding-like beta-propeller repeat protein [Bacteroidales bacterium]|nr:PQQ-binding-like beta-propeller repeat protein [Bacteroidales bacterium]
MAKSGILLLIFLMWATSCQIPENIEVISGTYLGNEQRNFYGDEAPSRLDTLWSLYLGEGISPAYGNPNKIWKGAGWTGQPLVIREGKQTYLIHGAFDYHLRKIDAANGNVIWQYKFDDIIKGTGTLWLNPKANNPENKAIIFQGSRRGIGTTIESPVCPSFRAVSYFSGKELWRLNVKQTLSYSRDVDGSALIHRDTGYIALENGLFTVFNPDPEYADLKDGILQPQIYKELYLYEPEDTLLHGSNIETESAPCLLNDRIYITAGSGRVYGYNLKTGNFDWIFYIGADLNGSPSVTSDNCLIIPVEKQYIQGRGGVFKLDPSKAPEKSVVWYFPVNDTSWYHWEGGIVGSVALNDAYKKNGTSNLAAFVGVDGYLYVVDHKQLDSGTIVQGPDLETTYPTPKLVCKEYVGGTISTPVITKNKLVVPLDNGLMLYAFDKNYRFQLLDKIENIPIDATPVVYEGKIFVASHDGYLYCFGNKEL